MKSENIFNLIELRKAISVKVCWRYKLRAKLKAFTPTKPDKQTMEKIRNTWLGVPVSWKWMDWYRAHCEAESPRMEFFVPDDLFYGVIDLFYNNYTACKHLDDKNFYDLLFHDVRQPVTIARKMRGILTDANFNVLTRQQCADIVARLDKGVIVKPSVLSCAGQGIKVCPKGTPSADFLGALDSSDSLIVQELVSQHPVLANLHAGSVNTLRLLTWIRRSGEVVILNAIVRMGVGSKSVDNASAGGIFCGIDGNGRLKPHAYNTKGERFDRHPDGASFENVCLPGFDRCRQLVCELAPRATVTSRLVSWDLAIGEDGEPILIEANLSWGEIDFHQITNGPLFGQYTPEMIAEVFSSKRNRRIAAMLNL